MCCASLTLVDSSNDFSSIGNGLFGMESSLNKSMKDKHTACPSDLLVEKDLVNSTLNKITDFALLLTCFPVIP